MGKRHEKISRIGARVGRIEVKCNLILSELAALRHVLIQPRHEIDDVIARLHRTANAMRSQSKKERRFFTRRYRDTES